MASTTSTEQSGLFEYLLPKFQEKTGIDRIEVRVVAQGTGQAPKTGENADADVVFVHDPVAEQKFVAGGFGINRKPVMYNDFILVGPATDPAGVKGSDDASWRRSPRSSKRKPRSRRARRRFRHPQGRAAVMGAGRPQARRELVSGNGLRDGADAQHGVWHERLRSS